MAPLPPFVPSAQAAAAFPSPPGDPVNYAVSLPGTPYPGATVSATSEALAVEKYLALQGLLAAPVPPTVTGA